MLEQFKSKLRFIPVGTGNTFTERAIEQVIPVHPRGHGEHYTKLICAAIGYGSSPWARGTPTLHVSGVSNCRFIPVGTGNTPGWVLETHLQTVQSRGHGEHVSLLHCGALGNGSSPWARGTRGEKAEVTMDTRFIPVGTGNTLNH